MYDQYIGITVSTDQGWSLTNDSDAYGWFTLTTESTSFRVYLLGLAKLISNSPQLPSMLFLNMTPVRLGVFLSSKTGAGPWTVCLRRPSGHSITIPRLSASSGRTWIRVRISLIHFVKCLLTNTVFALCSRCHSLRHVCWLLVHSHWQGRRRRCCKSLSPLPSNIVLIIWIPFTVLLVRPRGTTVNAITRRDTLITLNYDDYG